MKNIFLKIFVSILVIATNFNTLHAQKIITVSGIILGIFENELNPFPPSEKVYVFSFYTIEAAKDALQCLDRGESIMPEAIEIADPNGYYKIPVTENGALIIWAAMHSELIEVKGRNVINCNMKNCLLIDILTTNELLKVKWNL